MTLPPRYASIQIARAFAALAVLAAHAQSLPESLGLAHFEHSAWSFGQAGVDIFFVISGFIIAAVVERTDGVSKFVARRALRILPFYWFFTAIWALILLSVWNDPPDTVHLAASMAILPQDVVPVLGVGWSLEHELIFYGIVALLIAFGRADDLFGVMAVVASASIVAHVAWPSQVEGAMGGHLLSLYHVQFFAGVALFRWRKAVAAMSWDTTLLFGAFLFPASAIVLHFLYGTAVPAQPIGFEGIARVGLWGLASALVLSGLLAFESQRADLMRSRAARALVYLGGASYTLYLSHPIVIAGTAFVLEGYWPTGWPPFAAEVSAMAAALCFALIFYRWIEAPSLRHLNALADHVAAPEADRLQPSGDGLPRRRLDRV